MGTSGAKCLQGTRMATADSLMASWTTAGEGLVLISAQNQTQNAVFGKFGQLWHRHGCVAYLQWAPAVPNASMTPAWQPLIAWWPVALLQVRVWCWFQLKIRPKMLILANLANYDTDMVALRTYLQWVCVLIRNYSGRNYWVETIQPNISFFDKPHHQPPHWHISIFLGQSHV